MLRKITLNVSGLLPVPLALLLAGAAVSAEAQDADLLGDITVQATRVDKSLYKVPAAVGYVDKDDIQFGRQQLGLDESLVKVPGLFMQNRYNFAQDLRISIRGFGSRSSFGIRGIKLYVDGIPATLPDGQGGVDSIDIGSLDRIEVVRGPASSLYGTASGGVINMYTEDGPEDQPFIEARTSFGSYNFRKHQLKAGGQADRLNYLVNLSRLELDGYRDHSETENVLLNTKFRYDIDQSSDVTLTFNAVDSPEADDPGGLRRTGNAFNVDLSTPSAAQRNNLRFDAGESVKQQQLGLLYNKSIGAQHQFTLRNYYVFRDFDAKLPFGYFGGPLVPSGGIVDLQRFFVGGGGQYSYTGALSGMKNRFSVGLDIDNQMDERVNYTNIIDSNVIGPKSLDQDEDVFSWGLYMQNELALSDSLELTLGARYDEVEFDFSDRYFVDGSDDSGNITFSEISPRVGLLWSLNNALNVYGNLGTSFETPSSREFANPTAAGGFNPALKAQTAVNYELGIKGALTPRSDYELALFRIETDNELILAGQNPAGSDYYTNAGETLRHGLEASVNLQPMPGVNLSLAYTYSDFEFSRFTDGSGTSFKGNRIPGIPEHTAFAELAYYAPSGFYAIWDTQYVDKVFVDNANSDSASSYGVSNLRLGYSRYYGETEVTTFLGINNIFDKQYIGSVRVNEANSRYFEPAPERNLFAGIAVRFN
ncbi:TonB-dependent receptor family protein [Sedimenticola hydrogenitrophicus]|uniref:TonB-dependent receptor family protein n=1 Tax=Sedimenticola hydrogenitrophicus TaxID=2967975 RepID=UPI0023AEC363